MAEVFGQQRNARLLYTGYNELQGDTSPPAVRFLMFRGFVELERFCPSYLDLDAFEPSLFQTAIERVQTQGICLQTYAEAGDSPENRRRLHNLEQLARTVQPYREVESYIPEPFEAWEQGFAGRDTSTIFLAIAGSSSEQAWVGVVTGLEWYFTGVDPVWQGRGIATALKVQCLTEAKRRGLIRMETENHGDNVAILAVNRKLGFIFNAPEVACIKRF